MTKKSKLYRINKLKKHLFFFFYCVVAAIMMAPMIWAVSASLAGPGQVYSTPPKFFAPPLRFDNYTSVLENYDFFKYLGNTLFICFMEMIGVLISNSMIAFGFSKYDSKAINLLFMIGIFFMFVPSPGGGVVLYIMWSKLGMLDTYAPLIVPAFFGAMGWVFLLRQNFKSISNAFFEAAYIDGANPFYILWRVYVPLSKPVLANLMLRTFIGGWNNYMGPLIYLTTKEKFTVSVALAQLRSETASHPELQMAGSLVVIIPILFVYFIAQKFFVQGELDAGVKG